jgi:Tfp pilus assembly protein PilF
VPAHRQSPLDRATALQALGYAAYRAGNPARARQHFERALALRRAGQGDDHPDTLVALSDVGAACAAMGDAHAARAAHETALAARRRLLGNAHPVVAVSLHNLGTVCSALGEAGQAETYLEEALAILVAHYGDHNATVAKTLTALAALARERRDAAAALLYANKVVEFRRLTRPPGDPGLAAALEDLAAAHTINGDTDAAEAALAAAHRTVPGAAALRWTRLGTFRRRLGDLPGAAAAFTAALEADPACNAARHNLATTLTRLGRPAEAKPHRDQALQRECVFTQPGPAPAVLILATAQDGNIPLEHLLPEGAATRIWWFIDHARDPRTQPLPPYDVVFNGIADPDTSQGADAKLATFLAICRKPVLNDPARIAHTRRDRLPARAAGLDLVIPAIRRLDAAMKVDIPAPVLIRAAGAHGGDGVIRLTDWSALTAPLPAPCYVSAFHDTRSPDGFCRKYRMIFVDRVAYPYHLAISSDWLVHYFSADMAAHPWKLAEEAAFLADPLAALGARAYDAIAALGRRLDLAYCGVDFTVLPDGRALIFEANATMLVHPETGTLAHKNPHIHRITDAVLQMIQAHARK